MPYRKVTYFEQIMYLLIYFVKNRGGKHDNGRESRRHHGRMGGG